MGILTDILIVGSAISFITGFLSLFIKKIRIKQKSRLYFFMALLLFVLAITIGWSDFVAGAYDCPPP
jgi:hypothetical protein